MLALVCVLLQAALAGMFVTGDVDMLDLHALNAQAVNVLAVLQVVTAVLLWRRNRGVRWPMAATVLLLVLVGVQQILGDQRVIAWHILVGTAIVGAQSVLVGWSFLLRAAGPADASRVAHGRSGEPQRTGRTGRTSRTSRPSRTRDLARRAVAPPRAGRGGRRRVAAAVGATAGCGRLSGETTGETSPAAPNRPRASRSRCRSRRSRVR
ncbi:hypothetical protein NKH77_39555 [Streptomyces sp. M19]